MQSLKQQRGKGVKRASQLVVGMGVSSTSSACSKFVAKVSEEQEVYNYGLAIRSRTP